MIRKEIFDVIHKTIYQFIDGEDNVEEPMSDKDKLLLEVNKAICNNLKALEQEPKYCDRNICISNEYNGIGCEECEVTKSQNKIKEILDGYDGSMPSMITQFNEIQKLIKSED